ncbi:MAG TPA: hypothetical protein VMV61_03575, partial [Patescibacteria group bacterium]|nr:hypothetical protein [Patescibacteria group bacterium]
FPTEGLVAKHPNSSIATQVVHRRVKNETAMDKGGSMETERDGRAWPVTRSKIPDPSVRSLPTSRGYHLLEFTGEYSPSSRSSRVSF